MAGETPCVEWGGARNAQGYGVMPKAVHGSRLAHRAALAEKLGRAVQGVSRHTCDNPPCVNPDHLVEGTQADNVADAVERGRQRGAHYDRSTCSRGHTLVGENLILKPNTGCRSGYERVCRACRYAANQRQSARRKAARHGRGLKTHRKQG